MLSKPLKGTSTIGFPTTHIFNIFKKKGYLYNPNPKIWKNTLPASIGEGGLGYLEKKGDPLFFGRKVKGGGREDGGVRTPEEGFFFDFLGELGQKLMNSVKF